ncbi:hypothetical protein HL658_17425 [Azospirillum sp. RWY-5-1]|uniref:Uncharacterized protein n=1 Tax=Azospirillum oleiclasticum TaxID=2735135 RepID=A0ABX2TGD5_9PROT|nr:hypothetical protein [Azospirillum oleiclasticum]NYZ14340.1 hypothetical protein [Azospirillum oleiclasticum]NYZ23308.1 hypothetical protein [Azospirillum oleiclasticum]
MMVKTITLATFLSACFVLGLGTGANAWERNRSFTGPWGSTSYSATGSCSSGSCSRQTTRTGPEGRTATRTGSAGCVDGACSASRTVTTPAGDTYSHTGSISR